MSREQWQAILPILHEHDGLKFGPNVSLRQLQKMINEILGPFREAAQELAKAMQGVQPFALKVARYDEGQKKKRRHDMIYGQLDGRRRKR